MNSSCVRYSSKLKFLTDNHTFLVKSLVLGTSYLSSIHITQYHSHTSCFYAFPSLTLTFEAGPFNPNIASSNTLTQATKLHVNKQKHKMSGSRWSKINNAVFRPVSGGTGCWRN